MGHNREKFGALLKSIMGSLKQELARAEQYYPFFDNTAGIVGIIDGH